MKLYNLDLSGNCYKVRLFASLNRIPLEIVHVDFLGGAHKRPPLVDLNPLGQLPILEDDGLVLRDSQAILVYLARRFAPDWLPTEPAAMARVVQWLSTAANEIQHGPGAARSVDKFGAPLDKAVALAKAAFILPLLERHLANREWLEEGRPTIADCAVMPYVALAPEGGVDVSSYPAIAAWIGRIKALPGFIVMPGIEAAVA